jgi:hypothetical protein
MEGVMTDEEIRALLADVTPGPWRITPDEEGEPALCVEGQGFDICTAWGGYNAGEADARFIAASRDLVPALLARAEAAEARERALLAAAAMLADAAYRTIHDDADTSLVDALDAYREARK